MHIHTRRDVSRELRYVYDAAVTGGDWGRWERAARKAIMAYRAEDAEDIEAVASTFVGWLGLVEWHNADVACAPTGAPSEDWLTAQAAKWGYPTDYLFCDGT